MSVRCKYWNISHRCDPESRVIADRHYSRQTIGAKGFVQPGRCLVLKISDAYWVTSFPFPEYVHHDWPNSWQCSAFRNEGETLSSELILDAIAATRWKYGIAPIEGMITMVDSRKVRSSNPGFCFQQCGFKKVGHTKVKKLIVFQLMGKDMPEPRIPNGIEQ